MFVEISSEHSTATWLQFKVDKRESNSASSLWQPVTVSNGDNWWCTCTSHFFVWTPSSLVCVRVPEVARSKM